MGIFFMLQIPDQSETQRISYSDDPPKPLPPLRQIQQHVTAHIVQGERRVGSGSA